MSRSNSIESFCKRFCRCLIENQALDAVLAELLDRTKARATGLWFLADRELHLVAFQGVSEMPEKVKQEFIEATRHVPLTQTGLGIVKAVVKESPALSFVDAQPRTAATSAGWLERFGARSSVAVPVKDAGRIVGVLAISTAEELSEGSPAWSIMVQVALSIGNALSASSPRGPN
ncbi:MAG: GAF domain-containing protein [Planctomycetes bacterium]|nr:GAF domain-containing protein [Planctomycetota bacterium]